MAESKVPNQTLAASFGSRISAAYFPHGRRRTPLYFIFFTSSTPFVFSEFGVPGVQSINFS
ncbi:hypothetical protein Hanom_Chr12g01137121 [Helianthus anomalus]